jgi:signal transduction histidine kinase
VDTILNFRVQRSADGAVEEIRAALRDVTRRKKLQRQLVQTERLATTGRLAASVAHEINNPLQALLMHLSMVEDALPQDFPERDSWERIQQGIRRVNQVVQDLLDLHRVERARRRRVDLNKLVREALGLARTQLDASRVQTQVALEPGLPWVPGDPQHLYQIVLNLVLNGTEAMPSGGVLRVVTRSDPRRVTLEFQDTGRGIPSEELSSMFNPFFTRRGGEEPTGFGLFVTYSLVKEHHGDIEVEGHPGEGALIRVRLPREETADAGPAGQAGPSGTVEA